jgi:hypothetical protein
MSRLKGYLYKDDGTALQGATVTALESSDNNDGATIGASTTTGSDGSWSFTSGLTGKNVDVKIQSGTSIRYLKHQDQVQVEHMWVRSDTAAGTPPLRVENAVNNASNAVLELVGDNSTTADNDEIYISFKMDNSAGEETEFARITAEATDVTDSNEDGEIRFSVMKSGSFTEVWNLSSSTSGAVSMDMNVDSFTIGSGADTDITLTFDANTSDGVITWMEDEDYFQYSDDILMNSTEKILFGDSGTFIHQSADGVLTIESDTTVDINGAVALNGAVTGATNITLSGELDAATLDISGDADIDGTANLDNTDIDGTLVVDGSNISLDSTTTLNIDNSNTSNGITIGTATSGVPVSIGHTTSETTINDNLTVTGDFTVNGTTTTVNSTTTTVDDPIFTLGGDTAPGSDDNKDRGIEFRYHDGSSARVGFFGFDDSASLFTGFTAATNSSEVFSGTDINAKFGSLLLSSVSNAGTDTDKFLVLDSSGNVDFRTGSEVLSDIGAGTGGGDMDNFILEDGDGTEVTISNGKEVKFVEGGGLDINWTDTDNGTDADPYDLTFTIAAAQTGITSIHATDLIIGEDAETAIDFGTDNEIDFKVDNANRLTLDTGALYPATNNQIDLGTSSLEFKDAFFDGTVTADAFAGPLTGDVTGNVSGTSATVTGAAQSNITSLGTLTTLTVDNVITNGTTIGHTDDTDLMTLADGVLTVAGEVSMTTLDIGGTNVTSTAAELNILDGVTSTASELNILDGVTSTTSELNLLDGGTSVGGSITVADADGFVVNDGGTMKTIPASDIKTYAGGSGGAYSLVSSTNFGASSTMTTAFSNIFTEENANYRIYLQMGQYNQSGTPFPYLRLYTDTGTTEGSTVRYHGRSVGSGGVSTETNLGTGNSAGSSGDEWSMICATDTNAGVIQGDDYPAYHAVIDIFNARHTTGTSQTTNRDRVTSISCHGAYMDMAGYFKQFSFELHMDEAQELFGFGIHTSKYYPDSDGALGTNLHGSNNPTEGMAGQFDLYKISVT